MCTSHMSSDGNVHRCFLNSTSSTTQVSSRARKGRWVAQAQIERQGSSFSQGRPSSNGGGTQRLNAQPRHPPVGRHKGHSVPTVPCRSPSGYPEDEVAVWALLPSLSHPPSLLLPGSITFQINYCLRALLSGPALGGARIRTVTVPTAE